MMPNGLRWAAVWVSLGVWGCADGAVGDAPDTPLLADAALTVDARDVSSDLAAWDVEVNDVNVPDQKDSRTGLGPLVVMTFNTGTSLKPPAGAENQGFQAQQAAWCDQWYGNGLAWKPFVEDARRFIAEVSPDVVVFQEIFYSGDCPLIPSEAQAGFVCQTWKEGDPTVVQVVTGGDYQVMCNLGKSDKCAAVHKRLGRFLGCDGDFCLEGMAGGTVEGCGKGSRIGRGVVQLAAGGTLTVVNVHGSSGFKEEDSLCRSRQFDQIFKDLGDGQPAANGDLNLILGDFNTDPGVMVDSDPSAKHLLELVGNGTQFHFITGFGPEAEKTYAGLFTIDHVISDGLNGTCWTAGVTLGHPAVSASVGFDHHPTVCVVEQTSGR